MAMQPEPVHRSSTRSTSRPPSQGSKPVVISSAIGERGTSARRSLLKLRSANQASPVRYAAGMRSAMRRSNSASTRAFSAPVTRELP
jgi:hypothetical protein